MDYNDVKIISGIIYNGKIVVGTHSIYTPNIKLCIIESIGRNKVTV